MPLFSAQASGGWTESSSALRLLNVQIRNSVGHLTDDAFTQTNPPVTSNNLSSRVNTTKSGVLSGSVAFTRYDAGEEFVGGPGSQAVLDGLNQSVIGSKSFKALGLFINSANGNPYENTPAVASVVGPYVSGMGTFGDALYETKVLDRVGGLSAGNPVTYFNGAELVASLNGYLMSKWNLNDAGNALVDCDTSDITAESYVTGSDGSATVIGILKMAPDAVMTELVYDQRI